MPGSQLLSKIGRLKKVYFITLGILVVISLFSVIRVNDNLVTIESVLAEGPVDLCVNPDSDHCFWVAESGSDTTGDGSQANPYQTLAPLFSVAGAYGAELDSEDSEVRTVVMRDGDYHHNGAVYIRYSNVVLRNYPGENPRLWLETDNSASSHALTLGIGYSGYTASNITVQDIEIEGGGSYTLKIYENTSDVVLNGNKIHGSGYDVIKIVGCAVSGHLDYDNYLCNQGAIIENNEIYDSGVKSIIGDEGIDAMGTYNTVVRHNYFHDIQGAGLYFKGHSKGILVEENYFYNTGTGGLEPTNENDTWGGLWFGDDSMDSYIPEPPYNYENEDSIARNNIIVSTTGDALRMMSCKNCTMYNNTVYNANRQEFPRGYLTGNSGAFSVFQNATRVANGEYVDELRERNAEVYFKNNILVDTIEQGYDYQFPIVALNTPFYNGISSDHVNMRDNVYYRDDGDYRFKNRNVGEDNTYDSTIGSWQSRTGLDQNSIIPSSPSTLLRIMADPGLSTNDPKSYLLSSTSEAASLKAGAYIDLTIEPWITWFPESCTNGQTRACVTSSFCAGTQTCLSSRWGECQDTIGDDCPVSCDDSDGDGYGSTASTACTFPDVDCNDTAASVNPGHLEICGNGKDDDCRGGDEVCQTCVTGDSVYGQIHAKGCLCAGEKEYNGYCCTGNTYNPYLACGYEACTPNQSCTTEVSCSGTCNALGTECVDTAGDSCPSLIFQDGLNGYTGSQDAILMSTKPTSPYGAVSSSWGGLGLWTEGSAEYKSVFKFDVGSIPEGYEVESSYLQLYVTSQSVADRSTTNISARRLLTPWVESEVTWNNATTSAPWSSAGADADGMDRNATPLVTNNPMQPDNILHRVTNTWISIDLLSSGDNVIEKWFNGTYNNYGIVLEIDTADARGMGFASNNYPGTQEFKPKLIINLVSAAEPDTPEPDIVCTEEWVCGDWSACVSSERSRSCSDTQVCGTTNDKPVTSEACITSAEPNEPNEIPTELPDTVSPNTTITSAPAEVIKKNQAMFIWDGIDDQTAVNGLLFSYRFDSGTWSDFSYQKSIIFFDLSNGSHIFYVRARDASGNVDPTPASITINVQVDYFIVVAANQGGPQVRIFSKEGQLLGQFFAYEESFRGGISITTGDLGGDGTDEIIVGSGPGRAPEVKIFRQNGTLINSFFAYAEAFNRGFSVSTGDFDGNGKYDIVTVPKVGGAPNVRIFGFRDGSFVPITENFMVYDPAFRGGVSLTACDIEGDGIDEIITAPKSKGGPHVQIFGMRNKKFTRILPGFMAYTPSFRGGLNIACGDVNGDTLDEIITVPISGGGPHVQIFGRTRSGGIDLVHPGFMVYNPSFRGGVSLATINIDYDREDEILTGVLSDSDALLRIFYGNDDFIRSEFFAFPGTYKGGIIVASGK